LRWRQPRTLEALAPFWVIPRTRFATAFRIPLLPFVATLAPLSIIGLVLLGLLLTWRYRREFSREPIARPTGSETAPLQRWMLTTSLCSVLGMLIALSCGARPAAAAMAGAAGVIVCGPTRPREV
jgi:Na+/H+ antiporter NhaD/arsenite permease-like protein